MNGDSLEFTGLIFIVNGVHFHVGRVLDHLGQPLYDRCQMLHSVVRVMFESFGPHLGFGVVSQWEQSQGYVQCGGGDLEEIKFTFSTSSLYN